MAFEVFEQPAKAAILRVDGYIVFDVIPIQESRTGSKIDRKGPDQSVPFIEGAKQGFDLTGFGDPLPGPAVARKLQTLGRICVDFFPIDRSAISPVAG